MCDDPAWAEALRILFVDWPTTCQCLREAEGAERTMLPQGVCAGLSLGVGSRPELCTGLPQGARGDLARAGAPVVLLPVMQIGEADRPEALRSSVARPPHFSPRKPQSNWANPCRPNTPKHFWPIW